MGRRFLVDKKLKEASDSLAEALCMLASYPEVKERLECIHKQLQETKEIILGRMQLENRLMNAVFHSIDPISEQKLYLGPDVSVSEETNTEEVRIDFSEHEYACLLNDLGKYRNSFRKRAQLYRREGSYESANECEKYATGMRITKSGNNLTYTRILVGTDGSSPSKMTYERKYHYLPIPLDEVVKLESQTGEKWQNYGW